MKKSEVQSFRVSLSAFAIIALMALSNSASAETLDSVSHIHHVKVVDKKILVLTHEGLYELVKKNDMRQVVKNLVEGAGYSGWFVLEQDLTLSAEPLNGVEPIETVRRSVEFLRALE